MHSVCKENVIGDLLFLPAHTGAISNPSRLFTRGRGSSGGPCVAFSVLPVSRPNASQMHTRIPHHLLIYRIYGTLKNCKPSFIVADACQLPISDCTKGVTVQGPRHRTHPAQRFPCGCRASPAQYLYQKPAYISYVRMLYPRDGVGLGVTWRRQLKYGLVLTPMEKLVDFKRSRCTKPRGR